MPAPITLDALRRYAVARTLFKPTTLPRAIERLGFVQADPIRSPARAQDLTLRHRVKDYRAGDLERRYARLSIEEDCFVNYGFLPRRHLALMHPRAARDKWDAATRRRAQEVLDFIRRHGPVHPREVQVHFEHGRVKNYWGGSSNAVTHLLDGMHYRGMLRVVRRDSGTRVYAAVDHAECDNSPAARMERARALVNLIVAKYAPLPAQSLTYLCHLLRYGAPHLREDVQKVLREHRLALPQARVDGTLWLWPEGENPASARHAPDERVRLLAPFDPVVWDRRRFTALWGWTYRFEAYTPAPKRQFGYYAMPLLWHDRVVGWANASATEGYLSCEFGYASGRAPRDAGFRRALDEELARMVEFLNLE
jgi:uncharacterized protein YcaQ